MGYRRGSSQGEGRGRELALALLGKDRWKPAGSRVDETFGGFSRGPGLHGRIICSWRLKRLSTSSWGRAQHLSRRGAEGMLLYLSVTTKGLRNLWMQEEERGGGFQPGQGWVLCPVGGRVSDRDTPGFLTRGSRVGGVRAAAIAGGCGCWLLRRDRLQRAVPEREVICNCLKCCLLAFSGSPFTLAPDLLCTETQEMGGGGGTMCRHVTQVSVASVSISLTLHHLCCFFFRFLIKEFYSPQDNLHILPTGGAGKGLQ